MLGAIIGDTAGSRFEFDNCKKKTGWKLLDDNCRLTDDSVMTLAVGQAILDCEGKYGEDYGYLSERAVIRMQELGKRYPAAGYGGRFRQWLRSPDPQPYNSWGNGAAMRVSPCGDAAGSLEEALAMADAVTRVTHDHPDGMAGAEAAAGAVYLAGSGCSKAEIRQFIEERYYKIDFTLDQIRKSYRFDVSCRGSVPQAMEAFFESEDFESAIRLAVSIGGDSDTIAAICGGVAGAFYGIGQALRQQEYKFMDAYQQDILQRFESRWKKKM